MQRVAVVVAVEEDDAATARRTAPSRAGTALIVPSPASATSTTTSGSRCSARSTASPSSAMGERGPPTVSTSPTSTAGVGHGQLGEQVGDGRGPVDAEHVGRHRRRHRHRVAAVRGADGVGSSPVAAAEHLGVGRSGVVGVGGLRRLAGRDREPGAAQGGQRAAADPRLADLGGGARSRARAVAGRSPCGPPSGSAIGAASSEGSRGRRARRRGRRPRRRCGRPTA